MLTEKQGKKWEEILKNDASILLGTAGSGKTTEVRQQVRELKKAGQNAFLLRLEALQDGSITNAFDFDIDNQFGDFEKWKRSKSSGVIFLDALDEARLPSASNESALRNALNLMSNEIGRRQSAIHLVVTSRPSEWLGDPDVNNIENFIKRTRSVNQSIKSNEVSCKQYRIAPLTTTDIEKLAHSRDINSSEFLEAIHTNLSSGLIQQPLDAQLFLDVWEKAKNENRPVNQIFSSRLQVMSDLISWRLIGQSENKDRINIDQTRARQAVAKLAAFVVISGKQDLTSRPLNVGDCSASQILSTETASWTTIEIRELLACGLFQPSVGGRIRFAHNELRDFLAAEHFDKSMRSKANSDEPIKVLFANGLGRRSIPQSTERVLGWLSALNTHAKGIVTKIRPSLLIETGDPKSLSLGDRQLILRNQAKLYTNLKFRGEWFYNEDIARFAHPGLSSVVSELLDKSTSPELSDFLIEVARFGSMKPVAAKLADVVVEPNSNYRAKAKACWALLDIGDKSFQKEVLSKALTIAYPADEDIEVAPNWNMFQLKALHYSFDIATTLEKITLIARIRKERSNYSSLTSRVLIDILEKLTHSEKRDWLKILLRFASDGRSDDNYRMLIGSERYSRVIPAIVYLASELIAVNKVDANDPDILDAIELGMNKENRLDFFGKKGPIKNLTDRLRLRPDIKYALIDRRIDVFSDRNQPGRVKFGTIYPLKFNDDKQGSFFEKSDILHYCNKLETLDGKEEQAFWLDVARNIQISLKINSREEAYNTIKRYVKKFGDDEQKIQFGVTKKIRKINSKLRFYYLPKAKQPYQNLEKRFKEYRTLRKNRRHFYNSKNNILAGKINNSLAKWIFYVSPNDLGESTIRGIEKKYGHKTAELFQTGLLEFWKKSDTSYSDRMTYLGSVGLSGVNIQYSIGERLTDPNLSRKAFRYAFHQLNGFPHWVEELASNFPTEFCSEMKIALLQDFNSKQIEGKYHSSDCLNKLAHSGVTIRNIIAPMLLNMMMRSLPNNPNDTSLCLDIVARSPNADPVRLSKFLVSGFRSAWTRFDFHEAWVWLDALMNTNSRAAKNVLMDTFSDLGENSLKTLFSNFMGRGGYTLSLKHNDLQVREDFLDNPCLLGWLVKAAFLAWPPEKDIHHETSYSPGRADHATSKRRFYVNMLSAIKSPEALEVFIGLSNDGHLKSHRDTFQYQIEMMTRSAGRRSILTPIETIEYLNEHSKAPTTIEEFRQLCYSHLKALLEKLHVSDDDESAFFRQGDAKERDLRNWLAGRLREVGEQYYTVIREQEVAGEKRPDLRLYSRKEALGNVSIEIKLADMRHWNGDELVETPDKQLSNQYLLEPSSHTGIYVLVNAARPRKREKNPKTGKTIRQAFVKKVMGNRVNFIQLLEQVEVQCERTNQSLQGNKVVILVSRDISEKPSETA